jgi:alanyl-tRNA synthetase
VRTTARRALEIYLSDLREEIVKTERHEWRQALHEEKEILEGVIGQLSIRHTLVPAEDLSRLRATLQVPLRAGAQLCHARNARISSKRLSESSRY